MIYENFSYYSFTKFDQDLRLCRFSPVSSEFECTIFSWIWASRWSFLTFLICDEGMAVNGECKIAAALFKCTWRMDGVRQWARSGSVPLRLPQRTMALPSSLTDGPEKARSAQRAADARHTDPRQGNIASKECDLMNWKFSRLQRHGARLLSAANIAKVPVATRCDINVALIYTQTKWSLLRLANAALRHAIRFPHPFNYTGKLLIHLSYFSPLALL